MENEKSVLGFWDWLNEATRKFEEKYIIDPGDEFIAEKVGFSLKELGIKTWAWFIDVLPEMAGYGVIATGAFIMLAPMISRGGMMKPLAFLAGGLILSVCILMTN